MRYSRDFDQPDYKGYVKERLEQNLGGNITPAYELWKFMLLSEHKFFTNC